MLTVATVDLGDAGLDDGYMVDVDIDDNGWAYVKQGGDWICLPRRFVPALIAALQKVDP